MNREALRRLMGGMFFRIFILLAIIYTLYHCVTATDDRLTTTVVTTGSETELTEGKAIIVRDEQVLSVNGNGYLISYPVENGAKVSAATELATLYSAALSTDAHAQLQQSLHTLDRQLIAAQDSERLLGSATTLAMLSDIQGDIRSAIIRCNIAATGTLRLQRINAEYGMLLQNLNRYAALTSSATALQSPLTALQSRRAALLAPYIHSGRTYSISDLLPATQTDYGDVWPTGYFYHADRVDGYETVFNRADLATMNIVTYDALTETPPRSYGDAQAVLGKLVTDYRWSILLPVAYELSDTLQIDESYSVHFPLEDVTISMTLERIIPSVGDGRAILVLTAQSLPQSFRFVRFQTAHLELNEISGYRIPDTALHTVDGREGVYILEGGCVYFRAIHTIKRGEGYVLAAIPPSNAEEAASLGFPPDYLSLYDIVITSGKDLYDGKYIN